jgi:hypothetical protein
MHRRPRLRPIGLSFLAPTLAPALGHWRPTTALSPPFLLHAHASLALVCLAQQRWSTRWPEYAAHARPCTFPISLSAQWGPLVSRTNYARSLHSLSGSWDPLVGAHPSSSLRLESRIGIHRLLYSLLEDPIDGAFMDAIKQSLDAPDELLFPLLSPPLPINPHAKALPLPFCLPF